MGQLKRRRPAHLLRPGQMLATLGSLRLTALLQHGGIWLAVTPELAEVLNQCCTGQMDGGPGTAEEVAAVLEPLGWDPGAPATTSQPSTGAAPLPQPSSNACTPGSGPQAAPPPATSASAAAATAGEGAGQGARGMEGVSGAGEGPPGEEHPGVSAAAADAAVDAMELDRPAEVAASAAAAASATSSGPAGQAATEGAAATGTGAPVAAATGTGAPGAAGGAVTGRPGEAQPGRGRGRRPGWQPPPPYSPAAAGCRLVAVRLTLEEAFFMHYVLSCLRVFELQPGSPVPATSEHVRLLDTEGLWAACRAIRSNFVTSYVAYHHLKAKGWIPRSGLLYGVDFVVYQLHPVGCHSDFGVLVLPLAEGGRPAGPHTPPLGWLDLQITNRLVNQVVKKLILLYLYEQPGGPDHTTTACLQNFLVEERIVRRWVPDATRD